MTFCLALATSDQSLILYVLFLIFSCFVPSTCSSALIKVALNKSMFQFLNTRHREHLFLNLIVYFCTNENKQKHS